MTPTAAASAYAAMARAAGASGEETKAFTDTGAFGDVLKGAVAGFVEGGRAAEQVGVQAAVGQADVVDLVTAVAETELALETLVTVRDRVIQAYEEIMRMPI